MGLRPRLASAFHLHLPKVWRLSWCPECAHCPRVQGPFSPRTALPLLRLRQFQAEDGESPPQVLQPCLWSGRVTGSPQLCPASYGHRPDPSNIHRNQPANSLGPHLGKLRTKQQQDVDLGAITLSAFPPTERGVHLVRVRPTGRKVLTLATGSQAGAVAGLPSPPVLLLTLQHWNDRRRVGQDTRTHSGSGGSEDRQREGRRVWSRGVSLPLSCGQQGWAGLFSPAWGTGHSGCARQPELALRGPGPCLNPACGHSQTKLSSGHCPGGCPPGQHCAVPEPA